MWDDLGPDYCAKDPPSGRVVALYVTEVASHFGFPSQDREEAAGFGDVL